MKEFDLEYLPKKQYSCNEKFFNSINEKSAYWAGFIIADGCVRKHNYSYEVSINLATRDRDQLIKFNNELESDYPIHDYAKKEIILFLYKNCNERFLNRKKEIADKIALIPPRFAG